MNVTCNEGCQQEFEITAIKTDHVEKMSGNIERHYFTCPNCNQEYTSYFLDDSMKEIQQEIKDLRSRNDLKVKQKNKLLKLTRKVTAMNEAHKDTYRKLQQKHG